METNSSSNRLLLILRQQQARYAVPAAYAVEILPTPSVTALPRQPAWLKGLFSYKGHMVPALSLRALCGAQAAEEPVCAVLRWEDTWMALTADSAEAVMQDDGQRMPYDTALVCAGLMQLECVLPGEPAVLVLDLPKTYDRAAQFSPGS